MFNIGPTELILILVIALIVFGPRRLPEIGRTIGKSLREFRKASTDLKEELERDLDVDQATPPNPRRHGTEPRAPKPDTVNDGGRDDQASGDAASGTSAAGGTR